VGGAAKATHRERRRAGAGSDGPKRRQPHLGKPPPACSDACSELDGSRRNPATITQVVVQAIWWSGRRVPSMVAVGDEVPMNSHETDEDGLLGLSALSRVTRCLPGCCTPVTYGRTATCSLLVMQQTRNNKNKDLKGGRHARNEDELYKKAIALLEKCKMSDVRHRSWPV
jgi:hypothetical protein